MADATSRLAASSPLHTAARYSLFFVLIAVLASAMTITAFSPLIAAGDEDPWDQAYGENSPEWTPPPQPPGVDIDQLEYIRMWSGMKIAEENITDTLARNRNYTQNDAAYVAAARQDMVSPIPPTHPVEWNQGADSTFDGGSSSESIYPPGTDTKDGDYIKDAYIQIVEPTPSTRYHTQDGVKHLINRRGGILLANDFRASKPIDDSGHNVRLDYVLAETSQSDVTVTANGRDITDETTSQNGAVYVTFEGIPEATVDLTVEKEFAVVYTETKEQYLCDDRNCTSRSWVVTNVQNVTDTVTVSDTIEVTRNDPGGSFDVRPGPDRDYVRTNPPEHYSAIQFGTDTPAFSTSEVGFFTKRTSNWDTVVSATSSGVSDPYEHPFTGVQTHATPAYNSTFHINSESENISTSTVSENLGAEASYPPHPPNVDISTTTSTTTYREVHSATLAVEGLANPASATPGDGYARNVRYHPLVAKKSITTTENEWANVDTTNLTIDSEPIYADEGDTEPSKYRVTVNLTSPSRDTPIKTAGTDRKVVLNDRYVVNTNESGIGTQEFNATTRAAVGFKAEFVPQHPFDGEYRYQPATDSTPTPVEYSNLEKILNYFITDIALPVFILISPLLAIWLIAHAGLFGKLPPLKS